MEDYKAASVKINLFHVTGKGSPGCIAVLWQGHSLHLVPLCIHPRLRIIKQGTSTVTTSCDCIILVKRRLFHILGRQCLYLMGMEQRLAGVFLSEKVL